jgi:hypothetical protein
MVRSAMPGPPTLRDYFGHLVGAMVDGKRARAA